MQNWIRGSVCSVVVLLLCGMIMAEVSINCTCWQRQDNTSCSTVLHNKRCEDYSWKVNDVVVAHDQNSDQTLVEEHGQRNITFKTVQTNVTYSCPDMDTIGCKNIMPPSQSSGQEPSSPKDSHHGTIIGITFSVAFVLIILFLVCWKKNRLMKRFQDWRAARCRPDDTTTRRFINGGEQP